MREAASGLGRAATVIERWLTRVASASVHVVALVHGVHVPGTAEASGGVSKSVHDALRTLRVRMPHRWRVGLMLTSGLVALAC